jgi:hypothetical protein
MSLLDQAVQGVGVWGADRDADRQRCAALLQGIHNDMEEALGLWEEALTEPPAECNQFMLVVWVGAERARQLHRLYLRGKETAAELTELTGVPFKDTMGMAEEIQIVTAYGELTAGESGADRAKQAIKTLTERKSRVGEALSSF